MVQFPTGITDRQTYPIFMGPFPPELIAPGMRSGPFWLSSTRHHPPPPTLIFPFPPTLYCEEEAQSTMPLWESRVSGPPSEDLLQQKAHWGWKVCIEVCLPA